MEYVYHESHHPIGQKFSIIHKWMRQYFVKELKDLGIGPGQFPLIMTLFHNEGITQEELAGIVCLDKATTARGVKKLEDLGYLTREVNPDDRRAYRLHLTKKATDMRPRLRQTLNNSTEMITQNLTEEEKEIFEQLLNKMISSAPVMCRGHGRFGDNEK
jgi:DNA-binding MarR family transcriptional regulator